MSSFSSSTNAMRLYPNKRHFFPFSPTIFPMYCAFRRLSRMNVAACLKLTPSFFRACSSAWAETVIVFPSKCLPDIGSTFIMRSLPPVSDQCECSPQGLRNPRSHLRNLVRYFRFFEEYRPNLLHFLD